MEIVFAGVGIVAGDGMPLKGMLLIVSRGKTADKALVGKAKAVTKTSRVKANWFMTIGLVGEAEAATKTSAVGGVEAVPRPFLVGEAEAVAKISRPIKANGVKTTGHVVGVAKSMAMAVPRMKGGIQKRIEVVGRIEVE